MNYVVSCISTYHTSSWVERLLFLALKFWKFFICIEMHPHRNVVCKYFATIIAYARICKGVTEIEVRIEANGTQHLCHPRFQPYQKGLYWNLAQVDNIFSCGFQNYYLTLVMELLSDGHYKFYCQSKQIYTLDFNDNMNQFCLIMSFQKGSYKCQLCKRPYYGKGQGCQLANGAYDYASMPARLQPLWLSILQFGWKLYKLS
ncbi:unnamed protein product (macronuclear) [Paramecium tetraurelia]|uniref:Uncharacterized protein n=1 Tax=Paramecium tetraurelia TaxID=5888 RepID=A0CRY5_PARTE|nr:uncharacterized protein GSPATT00038902001 [Paramecium tetraurelia]CAK73552.1 unnamed protein product [Paramecium tetraurelia]|eukprot:XP_001440949.1 hypothetical protein (macronuclear) [Paramecium tetraurelia strain d4-2]